jgi:hypothetical protein
MNFPALVMFAIPIILLIGAVILRAAIALANRRLGQAADDEHWPVDENDWADYPIPGGRRGSSTQIPMPSVAAGIGMLLCIAIVNLVVGVGIRMVFDDVALSDRIVVLPVGFVFTSGLLAAMLPTTFRRGCLIAGYCAAICLGIAALLAVPALLFGWG